MIRILLNMVFWGFLGLVALPSLVPSEARGSFDALAEPAEPQTVYHVARLVGGMADDVGSLCTRQPSLCDSGRALADAALARAHQGLLIASDMLAGSGTDDKQAHAGSGA